MTPVPAQPLPGRLYLGWQYATVHPDPGPPPPRPVPPEREQLSGAWLAAQRREESMLDRPLKLACAVAGAALLALVAVVGGGWLSAIVAAPAIVACLAVGGFSGYAIWQGKRALRGRIAAEQRRVELFRADQEKRLFAWQAEHARNVREWQARRYAFENQKLWYAVSLPAGIDRVDVAGGTLSGWSAMLTMAGAYRLASGGEITVVDLSGGAVASDLLTVAGGSGIEPEVLVLPQDLPRLDLAASLDAGALADVLAQSASAGEEAASTRDLALERAILERVMGALGDDISMARVTAALRALAQVGDPRDDLAAGLLTEDETSRLSVLYGQGATDRVVLERALGIESQIRTLAAAGSALAPLPPSRVRVVAMDRRSDTATAKIAGSFVVTALTHLVAAARHGEPWQHTLFLLGAERLRDDVLDRLIDACENSRSGLVVGYRTIPARVRQRIGRGNAAVAFMRLGNAEEAKAASEQIGTQHRFVLSQLTETIGTSVTDSSGASYTSTVGDSDSVASSSSVSDSTSRGGTRGRSAESSFLPFAGTSVSRSAQAGSSRGTSDTESITAGITASTAWGMSTSVAVGGSESLARSVQRSREFLVEASELQRLPATAMIVSYATAAGRQVLLADANPAIGSLPVATITPLAEADTAQAGVPAEAPPGDTRGGGPDLAQPNLGPPAARLDWRRGTG